MGNKAPKAKALKIATGNPGRRSLDYGEPDYPVGCEKPKWLDRYASEEWDRVAPELAEHGVLAAVQQAALAAYCSAVSDLRKAQEIIAREGMTVGKAEGSGIPRKHPAVAIANEARKLVKGFAQEFGLTPASRPRVRILPAANEDPMERLLTAQRKRKGGQPNG